MIRALDDSEGSFVLRTTSVSSLDPDKGTLPLTRKNAEPFFRIGAGGFLPLFFLFFWGKGIDKFGGGGILMLVVQ